MTMKNEIITSAKVAKLLGCNKQTVLKWIREKKFKAEKIKKGLIYIYSIDYDSLIDFAVKRGYVEAPPEPPTKEKKKIIQLTIEQQIADHNKEKDQEQIKGKLFIIKVLGINSDSFINEKGKLTENKADAQFFTSENLAAQFIKNKKFRANNCKIIEK